MRLVIFLMIALLIVYGSLYPFSFSLVDPESWRTLITDFQLFTSRGDVLGNFVLFIPLGVSGMFAFQPRIGTKPGALAVLCLGFILAIALQWAQLYLPSRDAVLADVVWNILGLLFGIALAPVAAQIFHWKKTLPAVPCFLLALWFAQELVPFIPTLDLQKIKDSLKPLLLNADFEVANTVFHCAAALLAGRLLADVVGERSSLRWLLLCVAAVLAGKLLIVSRSLSLSLVIGLAAACGIWKWIAQWGEPRRGTLIMLAMLLALALTALNPFSLRWPSAEFNWIPFAGQLEGAMLVNLSALLERLFLYAGLLWLVQDSGRSLWPSAICLAVLALLLEGAQMFIVGRSSDITEAIWVFVSAAALQAAGRAAATG